MSNKTSEKKNMRVSKQQKEKLVDYMTNNLEFARGQFGGLNSNANSKEQWETLKIILNSLGGSDKTTEQWRKCWADLKACVRKQINSRRSFMNKTGGGNYSDMPRDLNALEEQILKIITTDAVDGDSRTPESGVAEDYFEETMLPTELLQEDNLPSPAKKSKTSISNSKYKESLAEARTMTNKVLEKLDAIEKQNALILQKIGLIETTLNILH